MASKEEIDGDSPSPERDQAPGEYPHIKLDTLADVERELARVYRNMRMGRCTTSNGHMLSQALQGLARVKRENVADEVLKRLELLEQRQAKTEEQAKSH